MGEATAKLGKIFIGGLSYETTDEKLRAYFSAFGPVTDAVVMKDPISRRSRGFGFITYADPGCVDRALAQPNHVLDNRRVEAKRAVPRAESLRDSISSTSSRNGSIVSTCSMSSNMGSTKKIFVGGLHYETKDAEFRRYFQQFGKVVSAEVMFNRETNKSRGFGFVVFENESTVELVLQENNHIIDSKAVEVKRAVPRTDMPPPRSVSSRAGSFNGTTGPGSVGSLDDISISSTASISRSGTPSSSLSASGVSLTEVGRLSGPTTPASGVLGNGLGGYAAAVRYGARSSIPRSSAAHASSIVVDDGVALDNNPEKTLARVADALTSLVLEDDSPSQGPLSSSSSRASGDKFFETPAVPLLSPLGIRPAPLTDPSVDQWSLSSSLASQTSGDGSGLVSTGSRDSAWQARSWQKAWPSHTGNSDNISPSTRTDSLSSPSYFAAFSNAQPASSSSSSWSSQAFVASAPLSTPEFGSSRSTAFGHAGGRAFGGGGFGGRPRPSYTTLGDFLPPEYTAAPEPELPLETALSGVIGDFVDPTEDLPLDLSESKSSMSPPHLQQPLA
ncbi:hypothetical protein PINS_up004959 [Pythium insidiosum]|nr:hypothetical protein PINS_up004959 [Pythium insidiosum]